MEKMQPVRRKKAGSTPVAGCGLVLEESVVDVTNSDRADWAQVAVEAFAAETSQDTSGDLAEDKGQVIGDLLCNLMHLCRQDNINFEECLSNGRGNFEFEVEEETQEESDGDATEDETVGQTQ
jgi:hypothetical protein